jgi:hypothetical protein
MTRSDEEVLALFASTPGDPPGEEVFEQLEPDDVEADEPDGVEPLPSRFWTGDWRGSP